MFFIIEFTDVSIILNFTYNIGNIIFILYNTIMSLVLLNYYISTRPFYDYTISYLIGFFHALYAWTSLFTLLFYFIPVYQVSIVYITILLILLWMYYNMHQKMNDAITLDKPFHQLNDKFKSLVLFFYIKENALCLTVQVNSVKKNFTYQ